MDSLRLDVAVLVGLILQSFFYGVFQVLFIACVYVLVERRSSDRFNWHFLITAILMWILIGINFALSWSRIMDGFIAYQPDFRENPEVIVNYFSDLSAWKEVTRTGIYVGLTAVADSLFIFRCYVVWAHSVYIIILPTLLLCASITAGIGLEVVIATTNSGLFASGLARWATSFFSLSLIQNVLTTFLIVFRIWRVNMRGSRVVGSRSLWPVMVVVLESGALYSSTLFVLLMTYATNSFSQYIALDMLVPIIGITFTLIIVRVGLKLSPDASHGQYARSLEPPTRYPLQNLNINVSRHVTVERDMERGPGDSEPKGDSVSDNLDDPVWKRSPVTM